MINKAQTNSVSGLEIDLGGLEIEEVEVFAQEGSRAMPEFTASCGCRAWLCGLAACSCAVNVPPAGPF